MTVRASIRPASTSCREVAVRPRDDDLVGGGEAGRRREDGPRVAHRHLVAEELPTCGHGGGEVDGAEDEHPGLGGEGGDEDPHPLAAPLPVGPVGQGLGAPRGQQAAGVVGDGVVGPAAAQRCRSARRRRPPAARPADGPARPGPGGRSRWPRPPGGPPRCRRRPHRARGRSRWLTSLDEDVEDAPAGQPHGIRVVVADAVALQRPAALGHHGPPAPTRRPRPRRSRPTPSRRPRRPAPRASRHPAGRGAERQVRDDRAHADASPGAPPPEQLGQHLTHGRPPPRAPRTRPSSVRPRSRRRAAGRPRSPAGRGW